MRVGRALFGRDRALAGDETDLHAQELVEDQPPARGCDRAHAVGLVDRVVRRVAPFEAECFARVERDRIRERALRTPAQRFLRELRHLPGRDVGLDEL